MDNKLKSFEYIKKRIDNKVSILETTLKKPEDMKLSSEHIVYKNDDIDTSWKIIHFDENSTTKTIISDKPKRITCLSGEIILIIPHYDEKIIIKSLDTQLIPSNTYHIIDVVKPSKILVVYKNVGINNPTTKKITEKETIYSKL